MSDAASRPLVDAPAQRPGGAFEIRHAITLYACGFSAQRIADRLGYTRSYVCARLRQAGVTMRPASRPRTDHHLDQDQLVRLRHAGATWAELAQIFRVSRYAVRDRYLTATSNHDTGYLTPPRVERAATSEARR